MSLIFEALKQGSRGENEPVRPPRGDDGVASPRPAPAVPPSATGRNRHWLVRVLGGVAVAGSALLLYGLFGQSAAVVDAGALAAIDAPGVTPAASMPFVVAQRSPEDSQPADPAAALQARPEPPAPVLVAATSSPLPIPVVSAPERETVRVQPSAPAPAPAPTQVPPPESAAVSVSRIVPSPRPVPVGLPSPTQSIANPSIGPGALTQSVASAPVQKPTASAPASLPAPPQAAAEPMVQNPPLAAAAAGSSPSASPPTPGAVPVAVPPAQTRVAVESKRPDMDVGEVFRLFMRQMQVKEYAQAQATADRISQAMGASHVMSLRMQAYLALAQNKLAQAMEQYLQLLAAFPDDREAGFNLAVIDWRLGNKASAVRRAQALMQRYPDDVEVRTFYFSIRSS
jgi:hypothetical protein